MGSPIEIMFMRAFETAAPRMGISLLIFQPGLAMDHPPEHADCHWASSDNEEAKALVFPQAHVDQYVVDFAILASGRGEVSTVALGVECDGHDWHERTKQQASYDRARDRYLLSHRAMPIVRFTGSDIHRDANQCAVEVCDILKCIYSHLQSSIISSVKNISEAIEAEKAVK